MLRDVNLSHRGHPARHLLCGGRREAAPVPIGGIHGCIGDCNGIGGNGHQRSSFNDSYCGADQRALPRGIAALSQRLRATLHPRENSNVERSP